MATAAELLAKITALEGALERHEQSVQFGDRTVQYSTTEQIVDRINYFRRQYAQLTATRSKQTIAVGSKGL